MKKVAIIIAVLCLLFSGPAFAVKIPPPPSYIIQASDCAFLTWFGALCHDTDDGKLYKWDGAALVELAAAAGAGDISDVWNCATGDCAGLVAGAADYLNATSASYIIPWVVTADCSAVVAEGRACWDSDNDTLYVGDAVAALSISNPLGTAIESAEITNDTIVNADINTAAAIAWSKMAALTDAHILVGSAANVATDVAVSGDLTMSNLGAFTIAANSVALATDTTGNYVATIADAGSAVFTVANSGSENAAVTLDLATGGVTSTHILNNTITTADLNGVLTFADGDLVDFGGITHTGATDEGLVLPTWANVVPTTDKKYLAADGSSLKLYNGGWVTIGATAAPTDASYLTLANDATLTQERVLTAGTNGVDFSDTGANGTLTINIDTTEIGTNIWGAGAAITWTFDASAGTDPTIVFGDGAITASVLTVTGALTANGGIVMGTGDGFTVNSVNLLSGDELDGTKIKDADYGDVTISAGGAWAVEDDSHAHTSTTLTLASTNLSDTANIALLDASNTFTGTTNTVGNATTDILAVQATSRGVGRAFTIDDDTTSAPTYATGTNELFVEGDIETDGNVYAASFIGGAGVDGSRGITFTSNTALTPTGDQLYFINDVFFFSQAGTQKTPVRIEDAQTITGVKTFENGAYFGDTDTVGLFRVYDGSTNYVIFTAPSLAANYTLTLPVDDGTANQMLTTNGSGVLSWSSPTATAAGAAGSVQFTSVGVGGAFEGDAHFIYVLGATYADVTIGSEGTGRIGRLSLAYEGGASDYTARLNPNSAMAGDVDITFPSYTTTLLGSGINTFTGVQSITAVNAAGAGQDTLTLSGTLGAMTNGDVFRGVYLNYTNANHTGTSNTIALVDIAALSGDADSNLYGLRIGNLTGTVATTAEVENAIKVGTGWDVDIELSDNTATITHTGTTSLTIASTSGTVVVEDVTFTGGAISGATYNGHTFTAGSSTFTGTAGQTYTFPTTSATLARTDAANSFTGVQTMTSAALTTPVVTTDIHAATAGGATLGTAALPFSSAYIGAAATNNIQITGTASSAKVATFPDVTGVVAVATASTTTTHALFATATTGAPAYRAIAAGDLPATLTSGTAITNAALTTPVIGAATGTSLALTGVLTGLAPSVIVLVPSGVHDGGADQAIMTDAGIDIGANALVGMTVYNVTDVSSCTITANAATTITCTLAGGTDNNWDDGDVWQVGPGPSQSGSMFYVNTAGTIRHPATVGYTAGYYVTAAAAVIVDMASDAMIFKGVLTSAFATLDAGDCIESPATEGSFYMLHNKSATSVIGLGFANIWIDGGAS